MPCSKIQLLLPTRTVTLPSRWATVEGLLGSLIYETSRKVSQHNNELGKERILRAHPVIRFILNSLLSCAIVTFREIPTSSGVMRTELRTAPPAAVITSAKGVALTLGASQALKCVKKCIQWVDAKGKM